MTQQLQRFFGMRVNIVRDLDLDGYSEFAKSLMEWLKNNPHILERNPHLYIHKLSFDSEPKHFTVEGIENRLGSMTLSVAVNESQQHKEGIRFINGRVDQRLSPTVKNKFHDYKNMYFLDASHFREATYFEEYLATIVHRRVTARERMVKIQISAYPTPTYGSQILKNIVSPTITKLDFHLNRDVQLTLDFSEPQEDLKRLRSKA